MAENVKVLATNRKAWHEYIIEEKLEAGIALSGTEVKSIRLGKVSFADSFVRVINGECMLMAMHISPYEKGNIQNGDPVRTRKLLLHKKEIKKLDEKTHQKGYTLIPLRLYLKRGLVKVEIGLCRGKKLYDKRHTEKERDVKRKMDKAVREYR
ncbi:MAG: SsrA-binding protein SmpB [Eubacteriales bacterium]